ncbi:MAG: amino acid aminotransferase [Pirellula sp.]|jgi:aspartate aminotransferase|nr:aspartate/tyrosine/aromatic aminotransferase [Pirellula sp.]
MFEYLPIAPPDSILGLSDAFAKDPRPGKINLTVGVYKTEEGSTPILATVKKAEIKLLNTENTKGYMPIEGHLEYLKAVVGLVFSDQLDHGRVAAAQTPGGTGALRVGADMVAKHFPGTRIWLSNPTWANHGSIFQAAGLDTPVYKYLSADKTSLDFSGMVENLERDGRPGDLVCLHACCHNPTGIDPSLEQWAQISDLFAKKKMIPFVDFAYQGFGDGLMEDAKPLYSLLAKNPEVIVCSSFSKNFGLYSERVGAVMLVSADASRTEAALSQIRQAIRCNYSNPPRHGASTVAIILNDATLRAEWNAEVDAMRNRISQMRSMFIDGMKKTGIDRDFSFLQRQKGMFSYSGLNSMQADWLKNERGIYIVGTGRINVAGMAPQTMETLCQSIADCIKATT